MFNIRTGTKTDLPQLMELIKELAIYEKALDQVDNNVAQMEEDAFGVDSIFDFIVAEDNDKIIGASIYYWRYSTWKGRRIYLEDLIVTEDYRGKGIGKKLFEETIKIGRASGASGMMWQVLDWNEPATNFYKKFDSKLDGEWINCHIDF